MIDLKTLRLIRQDGLQNFAAGRVLNGIAALRTLLPYCAAETLLQAEAESLEENYHRMLSFLRRGGNDKKRGEVQSKIQRQGVALVEQVSRAIRITLDKDLYAKSVKNEELTPILHSSFSFDEDQDDIFDALWTSPLWSAQDTAFWYDFILRQRDIVQQHLIGALFLSLWEYYDAEKMQLLGLLADSECHRTRITAVTYLLLLRLRHKELVSLLPPLPDSLRTKKGRKLVAQVQYEMLLMLVSEKDLEKELKEAESLTKKVLTTITPMLTKGAEDKPEPFTPPSEGKGEALVDSLKGIISLRGRYLRNRLQRGLDINLSKIPLLHNCEYMRRVSHWFLPFDKTHPLFQSVMIDEKGNEKQNLSTLVDLIMDCDVDKLAMLYLVANDKDFSKAVQQLDEQELPGLEDAVIPEYTIRFIMQDLYRFFCHSPLHTQLTNPFREKLTLLDFPEIAALFSADDCVSCCGLLLELGRDKQVIATLDDLISREGASAPALMLKARALKTLSDSPLRGEDSSLLRGSWVGSAISCARSAEMLEPDNTDILQFLVECYAWQGCFEEELEYLQKLTELQPDNKALPRLIASATDRAGRKEEALQLFFKLDYELEESGEEHADIFSSIADIALRLGKLDIAERYTEKEIEILSNSTSRSANSLLLREGWGGSLRLGHIRLLQDNWKDALNHYEQFINLYCKETGKDITAALAVLDKQWQELNAQCPMVNDLLLIHDILQARADSAQSTMINRK